MRNEALVLHLHRNAPSKPLRGQPCNGCGICCAIETCPSGRVIFRQRRGPCPALEWQGGVYRCGLLASPARYIPRLPMRWHPFLQRLFARWIAAGTACDSDAEVDAR